MRSESQPATKPPTSDAGVAPGRLRGKAIAIGAAVDLGGTQLCVMALSFVVGIQEALVHRSNAPAAILSEGTAQIAGVAPWFVPVSTVLGLLCTFAGGFVTALLARTTVLLNATVTGLCTGSVGLVMISIANRPALTWGQLALAAITVPVATLGGLAFYLVRGRRR